MVFEQFKSEQPRKHDPELELDATFEHDDTTRELSRKREALRNRWMCDVLGQDFIDSLDTIISRGQTNTQPLFLQFFHEQPENKALLRAYLKGKLDQYSISSVQSIPLVYKFAVPFFPEFEDMAVEYFQSEVADNRHYSALTGILHVWTDLELPPAILPTIREIYSHDYTTLDAEQTVHIFSRFEPDDVIFDHVFNYYKNFSEETIINDDQCIWIALALSFSTKYREVSLSLTKKKVDKSPWTANSVIYTSIRKLGEDFIRGTDYSDMLRHFFDKATQTYNTSYAMDEEKYRVQNIELASLIAQFSSHDPELLANAEQHIKSFIELGKTDEALQLYDTIHEFSELEPESLLVDSLTDLDRLAVLVRVVEDKPTEENLELFKEAYKGILRNRRYANPSGMINPSLLMRLSSVPNLNHDWIETILETFLLQIELPSDLSNSLTELFAFPSQHAFVARLFEAHPRLVTLPLGANRAYHDKMSLLENILLILKEKTELRHFVLETLWSFYTHGSLDSRSIQKDLLSRLVALEKSEDKTQVETTEADRQTLLRQLLEEQPFPRPEQVMPYISKMDQRRLEEMLPDFVTEEQFRYLLFLQSLVEGAYNESLNLKEMFKEKRTLTEKLKQIWNRNQAGQDGQPSLNSRQLESYTSHLTKYLFRHLITTFSDTTREELMRLALNAAERQSTPNMSERRLLYYLLKRKEPRVSDAVITYLVRPDTDAHSFKLISSLLIKNTFFPDELEEYLNNPDLFSFLKKTLKMSREGFSQIIKAISGLEYSDRKFSITSPEDQKLVWSAITDMGQFGTELLQLYRKNPDKEKFVEDLKTIKFKIFTNTPLSEIGKMLPSATDNELRPLLVELAIAAYQPHNLTEHQVEHMLRSIPEDTYASLEKYTFPHEGYVVSLGSHTMELKPGKSYKAFSFDTAAQAETPHLPSKIADIVEIILRYHERIEKAKDDFQQGRLDTKLDGKGFQQVRDAQVECIVHLLRRLSILPKPDDLGQLETYSRLTALQLVLGKITSQSGSVSTHEMGINYLDYFLPALTKETNKQTADQIDQIVRKYLRPETEKLLAQLTKFEPVSSTTATTQHHTAIFTHTQQSFLGRSNQNLCTYEDTYGYSAKDVCNLDLVNTQTAQLDGSVLCYFIEDEHYFMMRQFNAVELLNQGISVESLCKEYLRVGIAFCRENKIKHICFPPDGSWHYLSNDPRIGKYLEPLLCRPQNLRHIEPYSVASNQSDIESVYVWDIDELEKVLKL